MITNGKYGCLFQWTHSCYKEIKYGGSEVKVTTFLSNRTLTFDPLALSTWHSLGIPYDPRGLGPVPRYGHVLIHCNDNSMYLVGGRSLEYGLLNDIWQYSFTLNTWTEIKPVSSDQPSPRYGYMSAR